MTYNCFLFDLDGTLTDPGIGITNSVMHALEKFDIRVNDRSELYPFIGPPLDDSFKRFFGFSDEQAQKGIEYYREYFRDKGIFENTVYDGIPEMLKELKDRGIKICLATSKPHEFAVRILEHFDLDRYFDVTGGATMDGKISKKADVIKHVLDEAGISGTGSVLMIGDRFHDIEGAKANGLRSCGVLWGYGSREELSGAGAEHIVSVPSELPDLADSTNCPE